MGKTASEKEVVLGCNAGGAGVGDVMEVGQRFGSRVGAGTA